MVIGRVIMYAEFEVFNFSRELSFSFIDALQPKNQGLRYICLLPLGRTYTIGIHGASQ